MSELEKGLARYLTAEWGRPIEVRGLVETSAGARRRNVLFDAWDGGEVQRLAATITPSAAMEIMHVLVESGALRMAEKAGVPVPHLHAVGEDPAFVGGPFFIGERVDGETVPRRVLRLVDGAGIGELVTAQIGRAFAALHAAPVADAPSGLKQPDPGVSPVDAGLAGLAEQIGELLQPGPALSLGFRWLQRNRPQRSELRIVHGDLRNGNLIVGEDGLRAVLDWEACHLGDPMEDLAWTCVRTWRFGSDEREVGGFAALPVLVDAYREAGGDFDPDGFHWWKVYGTLRWGIGLAKQAAQHIDGSVPSIVMAASGRRVAELEYDLLALLDREYGGEA